MTRFDVNLSILFTELPLHERPAAARAAGFDAVEFWWPFSVAVPADRDVDAFVGAVADAGGGVPRQRRGHGRRRGAAGLPRLQRAVRQPGRGRLPAGAGRAGGPA